MKNYPLVSLLLIVIFFSCNKNEDNNTNEVTGISLNKTTTYLIIGQTDSLSATLKATGDTRDFSQTWSSSNNSVATVDKGIVKATGKGTATITDKSGTLSSACEVTVTDKIEPTLTQGELWYYGDAYNTGVSNLFTLYLGGPGIDMTTLNGYGEIVSADFNITLSVKDSLPVGTYDMMTNSGQASDFSHFTLIPGYLDSKNGFPYGCWYFGVISDPASMGNIKVSRINDVYTVIYEFYDDYGVTISGTFKGTVNYMDGTRQSVQTSLKSRLKLKSTGYLKNSMKFQRR